MDPLDSLRNDVERVVGPTSDADWHRVTSSLRPVECDQGQIVFSRQRRQLTWLFITRGIAAAEQPEPNGGIGISRFFEPGQFCTNLTSLSKPEETGEIVASITPVAGVVMSNQFFQREYRSNGLLGPYLRDKIMEAILYDRELMRVKTANDLDTRYQFLASRNTDIVHRAPVADLARFIGIPKPTLQAYLARKENVS